MVADIVLTIVYAVITIACITCLILGSQAKDWGKRDKWSTGFVITFLILCFFNTPHLIHTAADQLWTFEHQKQVVTWLQQIFVIGVLVLGFAGGIYVIEGKKRQQEKELILECREALIHQIYILNNYTKHFGPPKDWEKIDCRDWEEAFKEFGEWVNSLEGKIDPWY